MNEEGAGQVLLVYFMRNGYRDCINEPVLATAACRPDAALLSSCCMS